MHGRHFKCLLIVTAILAACTRPESQPGRHHPDPHFLVREIQPTDTIALLAQSSDSILLPEPGADSVQWRTIGQLQGDEAQVLGEITQVLPTPDGRLLLLDRKSSQVHVYSPTGTHLADIGRPGRGPGDLFSPMAMAMGPDGSLLIGDMQRRIQKFRPDGTSFAFDTSFSVIASPIGLCTVDSLIVVQGSDMAGESLIQEYDSQGHLVRRFGSVYRSPLEVVNLEGARGVLACDSARGLIGFAPHGLIGEFRVFSLDGATIRLTILEGFNPIAVTELPNEGFETHLPDGDIHGVRSLARLQSGAWVLQVSVTTRELLKEGVLTQKVITLILPDSGRGYPASSRMPLLLANTGPSPIYLTSALFPQITWRIDK